MYTAEQIEEDDVLELSIGGAVRAMKADEIDREAEVVSGREVDLSTHQPTGLRVWARAEQITGIIREGVAL